MNVSCKLTAPELRQRKADVIGHLKLKMKEKVELPDGYTFRFGGSDDVVEQIFDFIKTERACCTFFTFTLTISNDNHDVWLKLTGPEGAKEFIRNEMEL